MTDFIVAPPSDPFFFFKTWFEEAAAAGLHLPEAMCLATVSDDGWPSARFVLLRGFDATGFRFYTNYESQKARELLSQPRAALTFHWSQLERQVRIQGAVEKTTKAESDAYWKSRPRGNRLGALASQQSRPLKQREDLLERAHQLELQYQEQADVPRPPHWGGFRVIPRRIEFWQGRPDRLHDRVVYVRAEGKSEWQISRLQP